MRTTYRLPERDFENYVIPETGRLALPLPGTKKKRLEKIRGELERLHPGFGPAHVIDIKTVPAGKRRWYLVAVIQAELLAEHRVLAGRAPLVGARRLYGDGEGNLSAEPKTGFAEFGLRGKSRYLFRRPSGIPTAAAAAFIAVLAALALTGSLRSAAVPGDSGLSIPDPKIPTEGDLTMTPRIEPMPDALELFRHISGQAADSGGILSRLRISLDFNPGVELCLSGADPSRAMAAFGLIGILARGSFGDIGFTDNRPSFEARFALSGERPLARAADPDPEDAQRAYTALQSLIAGSGGQCESYRFLDAESGRAVSLSFSVSCGDSPRLLLSLSSCLESLCLRPVSFLAESGQNGSRIRFELALRKRGPDNSPSAPDGISFSHVPRAFGFAAAEASPGRISAAMAKSRIPPQDWQKLGSIKAAGGGTIVYWRDTEGKIHGLAD